jgi:hypothetical protein
MCHTFISRLRWQRADVYETQEEIMANIFKKVLTLLTYYRQGNDQRTVNTAMAVLSTGFSIDFNGISITTH